MHPNNQDLSKAENYNFQSKNPSVVKDTMINFAPEKLREKVSKVGDDFCESKFQTKKKLFGSRKNFKNDQT